jgi:hypothetical protein
VVGLPGPATSTRLATFSGRNLPGSTSVPEHLAGARAVDVQTSRSTMRRFAIPARVPARMGRFLYSLRALAAGRPRGLYNPRQRAQPVGSRAGPGGYPTHPLFRPPVQGRAAARSSATRPPAIRSSTIRSSTIRSSATRLVCHPPPCDPPLCDPPPATHPLGRLSETVTFRRPPEITAGPASPHGGRQVVPHEPLPFAPFSLLSSSSLFDHRSRLSSLLRFNALAAGCGGAPSRDDASGVVGPVAVGAPQPRG